MAGVSEFAPRQLNLLSDQAKQNIAVHYLKEALAAADAEKHNPWNYSLGSFENIRIPLWKKAGLELPSSLVEGLNLEKLNWQILGVNPVSIILIGGNFPKPEFDTANGTEKASLNNALAVIDITRQGNPIIPSENWKPFHLRIAGVVDGELGGKRVVAATYDLEDNNRLTELNVSMSSDECPGAPNSLNDKLWKSLNVLLSHTTVGLPSIIKDSYTTAAFVTQRMLDEIAKAADIASSPHENALAIKINQEGIYFAIKGLNLKSVDMLNYHMSVLGYYARRENGAVRVGLTKEAARQRGIAPWEISLPASLSKA